MHYREIGRVIIYAAATAALSLGLLGGNTYAQSLANDIGSENMLGVQFVQAGPALIPTQAAGVIPQTNFNPVFVNNSTGTSGTTGDLADAFGNNTGITLMHSSNDGYNSNVETNTADGTLLHGEDKSGPAGRTLSNNPGLTSTYTFNNVPTGNYALIAYTENDWSGVNANLTVGATTNYITDQAVGGVPDATPQPVPAFLSANNTNPNTRVTGNYVTFNNVTPVNGQITLTNTSEGGANDSASINGFQLVSLPSLATQTTTTPASSSLTQSPQANVGKLMGFDSATGQFDLDPTKVSFMKPNEPTIVLTHGWQNSPATWAASMAAQIEAHAQTPVNIVAWNWSQEASNLNLASVAWNTPVQGDFLAAGLMSALGTNYSEPIHFIGHSFGTMVNAQAINALHVADATDTQIQDTLLDDAEIGGGFAVSPIPTVPVAWIDNYISAVGNLHQNATNIILQGGPTDLDPYAFHAYPEQWYQQTIGGTNFLPWVGFQADITQGGLNGQQPAAGTYYIQNGNGDNLTPVLGGETGAIVLIAARDGVEDITGIPSVVLHVTADNLTSPIQAFNAVTAGVTLVDTGSNKIVTSLAVTLSKELSSALGPMVTSNLAEATIVSPTSSSYAWIPVVVPTGAQYLSLDFALHGLSPQDFFTVGVNNTLLMSVEDDSITNGIILNSGLIDISQWSGDSIQLFLGLNAIDNNNLGGTVTVDNIEFSSVPEPRPLYDLCVIGFGAIIISSMRRRGDTIKSCGRSKRGGVT